MGGVGSPKPRFHHTGPGAYISLIVPLQNHKFWALHVLADEGDQRECTSPLAPCRVMQRALRRGDRLSGQRPPHHETSNGPRIEANVGLVHVDPQQFLVGGHLRRVLVEPLPGRCRLNVFARIEKDVPYNGRGLSQFCCLPVMGSPFPVPLYGTPFFPAVDPRAYFWLLCSAPVAFVLMVSRAIFSPTGLVPLHTFHCRRHRCTRFFNAACVPLAARSVAATGRV